MNPSSDSLKGKGPSLIQSCGWFVAAYLALCTVITSLKRGLTDLAQCILVDSSTVVCWMSPFVILGVSGLFGRCYSIFDGKSC